MSKQVRKLRGFVSLLLTAVLAASCFSISAAAAENVNPDVPAPICGSYVSDTVGWKQIYIYAWDAEGNQLCGDWPGSCINEEYKDEYGNDMYYYNVPDGAVGIIFNSGFGGEQTVDITDLTVSHYYITSKRDPVYGRLCVSDTYEAATDKSYQYGDVDLDGNITIADATMISFYLAQFEDYDFTELQKALADVDNNGIISIADVTTIQFYLAELGSSGRTGEKYAEPEYESSMFFTDTLAWGNVNLYAWDNDGNPLCGEWPGEALTDKSENDFGENVFVVNVPKNAVGIVLNNGSGEQTEDITDFSIVNIWLPGSKDEEGHYTIFEIIPHKDFCSIDFVNSVGWENVYIYSQGITDLWPGTAMSKVDGTENTYRYYYPMWELGELIVFNNGEGDKTVSAYAQEDGVYLTKGERDDNNYLIIYPNANIGEIDWQLYFMDSLSWGNVYEYAWDADGNALVGEWPGTALTQMGTNDYGENVFVVNVPKNAAGIVLNNGLGDQTEDITDLSVGYIWLDGSKNENGHFLINRQSPPPDPDKVNITFFDTQSWGRVNIYAWDADGNSVMGDWPGTAMIYRGSNDYGEPYYTAEIPDEAVGIVFNSGMTGDQTEDVAFTRNAEYYATGERDEQGHLKVYRNINAQNDTQVIYFTNNCGWSDVYIYAWDNDDYSVSGDWPGMAMTYVGDNDYGEPVYSAEIPMSAVGVVFSSQKSGEQSIDLPADGYGYYSSGEKDSSGRLIFLSWDKPTI